MRAMTELMVEKTIGCLRGAAARTSKAVLVVLALLAASAEVQARQVSVEFAEGSLAPAAEEMAAAGVDGYANSLVALIEIAQRHGFGYGVSPEEVRDLVGGGYLAVGQINCSSLDAKAEAAQRLSRVLTGIAWMYTIGAGLTVIAPPVAGVLGFGALVSGIAATAAGWIAADYRAQRTKVQCSSEGGIEWFRPAARAIRAAVDPAIFRFSSPRSCGA
jgi:hypothetical protein